MKYLDKFIKLLFGKYVTKYELFSKSELELELIDVQKVKFIPNLKNGFWLESTYRLLLAVIGIHIYKYFTELDNITTLKSFIYSILGILFWRSMIILDKNIRIFRITKQLEQI